MIGVYIFISLVILQRIVEVIIANRNAKWIKRQGGYEVGRDHYKYIVLLHTFFFISLLTEVSLSRPSFTSWVIAPFVIFLLAQICRVWALSSLGPFWNTRIMVLPGAKVIAKGPYRYLRHPNYVIVSIEILLLPVIFQAYWTAFIFSVLNVLILSLRIKIEEQALLETTNYEETFDAVSRFVPRYEK
ncbi:isoprenylcysteine carboxyl methyltransferase [Anaerobacillus alkaliphilus]|uniref:Isoprenylcysteine carboxyl methyltransferase n=1 Tax=Anaerobacillus alkaliphilus TaxID=1548597 RepID=A0A4Q0VUV0_9BACI|nr:isoprenylcysteine carboxyl methyltransferase family protein [Anaerobacillus alkaliphilus]RXJ02049.1 isoprenylcysteine carboxyl methyltransferase [Anaerobacillus alkaliphilus]